jgi:hypothetical protein
MPAIVACRLGLYLTAATIRLASSAAAHGAGWVSSQERGRVSSGER